MSSLLMPYAPHNPEKIVTDTGQVLPVPSRMTLEEFRAFPWPELERWELVNGVPVMSPSPRPRHQHLLALLTAFVQRSRPDLACVIECDYQPPWAGSYYRPDLFLLSREAYARSETVPVQERPELVVEVLSPSTRSVDVGPKTDAYERAGIPELWLVDPMSGSLSIQVLDGDGSYRSQVIEDEGFVESPCLRCAVRIRVVGVGYDLQSR